MTETQWNKEIVRDYFRCAREGNFDRLLSYLHPQAVLEVPGRAIGGSFVGPEGTRAYFTQLRSLFGTELVPQINTLLAEGNFVTVDATVRGPLPSGEAFALRVLSFFELEGRKIARQTLFFDTEEMARRVSEATKEPAAA